MNAKQLFNSLTERQRQRLADDLIRDNVLLCQSSLVDKLLGEGVMQWDDVENLYTDNDDGESEAQEIYEWWAISDWFADKLREAGQPVLSNDYGTWWGRTCSGQSISCDYSIQMLACDIECEIQNYSARIRKVGL